MNRLICDRSFKLRFLSLKAEMPPDGDTHRSWPNSEFLENCPFFLHGQITSEDDRALCLLYLARVFVEIFTLVCLKLYSTFCNLHSSSNSGTETRDYSNMKEVIWTSLYGG